MHMASKGIGKINPNDIAIIFSRNLPSNEVELAQVASTLQGIVPDEILLSILPFVENVEDAIEKLKQQKKDAIKNQQDMFGMTANMPPEEQADETE